MLCARRNLESGAVEVEINGERAVRLHQLLPLLDRMLALKLQTDGAGAFHELWVRAFPCVAGALSYDWGGIVAVRSARTNFARALWLMLEEAEQCGRDGGRECLAWDASGTYIVVLDENALVQHALPKHLGARADTVPGTDQARLVANMFAEQMRHHGFEASRTAAGRVRYRQRDQAFRRDRPAASQALQPGPWRVFCSRGSMGASTASGHVVQRSLRGAAPMRQLSSAPVYVEVTMTDAYYESGFPFYVNASDLPDAFAAAAVVRGAA